MINQNIHSLTIGELLISDLCEGAVLPHTCDCLDIVFSNQINVIDQELLLRSLVETVKEIGQKNSQVILLYEIFEERIDDMLEHIQNEEWWFLINDMMFLEKYFIYDFLNFQEDFEVDRFVEFVRGIQDEARKEF